jgi:hypothetical protein
MSADTARAIEELARVLDRALGLNATSPVPSPLENISMEIKDAGRNIASSLDGVAEALNNIADAIKGIDIGIDLE